MAPKFLFLAFRPPLSVFVRPAILLPAQTIDLPSSKELIGEVPGHPAAPEQPAHVDGRFA